MCFAAFSIATRVRARDSVGRIVHFVGAAACDYCCYRRCGRCCCSFARRWAVGSGLCVEQHSRKWKRRWCSGYVLFPKRRKNPWQICHMRMSVDLQHTRKSQRSLCWSARLNIRLQAKTWSQVTKTSATLGVINACAALHLLHPPPPFPSSSLLVTSTLLHFFRFIFLGVP